MLSKRVAFCVVIIIVLCSCLKGTCKFGNSLVECVYVALLFKYEVLKSLNILKLTSHSGQNFVSVTLNIYFFNLHNYDVFYTL